MSWIYPLATIYVDEDDDDWIRSVIGYRKIRSESANKVAAVLVLFVGFHLE
jgi:hypothetical protein